MGAGQEVAQTEASWWGQALSGIAPSFPKETQLGRRPNQNSSTPGLSLGLTQFGEHGLPHHLTSPHMWQASRYPQSLWAFSALQDDLQLVKKWSHWLSTALGILLS